MAAVWSVVSLVTVAWFLQLTAGQTTGCQQKLDVVFVLDSSYSEGSTNFKKQLDFVKNVTRQFTVGRNDAQFGVVTFASSYHNEFYLNQYSTQSMLQYGLGKITYRNPGATYTNLALKFVRENAFLSTHGGRPDAEKVVIVLTDGQSSNPSLTRQEANLLHQSGTEVIAVGIGSRVTTSELNTIATDTKHVFTVKDFDLLNSIQTQLTDATCIKALPHCKSKKTDIVFAVDSSSSISSTEYSQQMAFLKNLVRNFDVSPSEAQISVVSFASSVYDEFSLKRYSTKTNVLGAISRIRQHSGITNTDKALSHIANVSFTPAMGGRPDAEHLVVVLTDGQSTNPTNTVKEADRLHKMGVKVVAIGVGSGAHKDELNAIATDSLHVFQVGGFDALNTIMKDLEAATCDINACKSKKADIVFLLDSSASEGLAHFSEQLEFVGNFTSTFDIGPDAVQVGLATFATSPKSHFWLNSYPNKTDLLNEISNVPYTPGSTFTDLGLELAKQQSFTPIHGARGGSVPQILIVMTDGQSTDPPATVKMAESLHRAGIQVIAIGIGSGVKTTELAVIASDKDHVFTAANFSALKSIENELTLATCKGLQPSKECGDKPADIVFVLDSSSSEGTSNFHKELNFVSDFVKQFQVDRQHVMFGLATFASYGRSQFYFNSYHDQQSVLNGINRTRYIGGTTRTDQGLQQAIYQFRSYHGARTKVDKVAIVLTDGQSTSPSSTNAKARELKNLGVKVISVGIGDTVSQNELKQIASDPQHVFNVSNFDALKAIEYDIRHAACGVAPPPTIAPECGSSITDIVFLLDSSGSEGRTNFNKQLDFVKKFAGQFQIGPKNVQVGVATFSTHVTESIKLNQYSDRPSLLSAVGGVHYDGGLTYTEDALKFARTTAFLPSHGGRQGASKLVVILTDGQSYNHASTIREANLLKSQPGVKVISVGIGTSVSQSELKAIASDDKHVYSVANFDALQKLNSEITFTSCQTCGFVQTADIIFALDSSGSEGPINFQKQLDFVERFVTDLPVGPHNVQFSVVTFGDSVQNEFYLNQYSQKRPILNAVQSAHNIGGLTQTGDALNFIRNHNILPANGARSNSSQFVIVLTDGSSTNATATKLESDKLKQLGITLMAIGIGSGVNSNELNTIASDPNHVFTTPNFDALQKIREDVKKAACEGVNTTAAPSTTMPLPTTTTTTTTPLPTTTSLPTTTKAPPKPSTTPTPVTMTTTEASTSSGKPTLEIFTGEIYVTDAPTTIPITTMPPTTTEGEIYVTDSPTTTVTTTEQSGVIIG